MDPAQVIRVPFHPSVLEIGSWGLGRLRPATTLAYLDLAAAVLGPEDTGPGTG